VVFITGPLAHRYPEAPGEIRVIAENRMTYQRHVWQVDQYPNSVSAVSSMIFYSELLHDSASF